MKKKKVTAVRRCRVCVERNRRNETSVKFWEYPDVALCKTRVSENSM